MKRLESYIDGRNSNDPYNMFHHAYYQSHDSAYYKAVAEKYKIYKKLGWFSPVLEEEIQRRKDWLKQTGNEDWWPEDEKT